MPRPLRFQEPGSLFHMMARGDGGKTIFEDDDRKVFRLAAGGFAGAAGGMSASTPRTRWAWSGLKMPWMIWPAAPWILPLVEKAADRALRPTIKQHTERARDEVIHGVARRAKDAARFANLGFLPDFRLVAIG